MVEYDPKVVSFDRLVSLLWNKIDPTQRDGQGNDRGSQYRVRTLRRTAHATTKPAGERTMPLAT